MVQPSGTSKINGFCFVKSKIEPRMVSSGQRYNELSGSLDHLFQKKENISKNLNIFMENEHTL